MGGANPKNSLLDNWEDYASTEVCIDFAAQAVFPLMILSQPYDISASINRKAMLTLDPSLHKLRNESCDLLGRKNMRAKDSEILPLRLLRIRSGK
jgi:hypothetical protein